MRIMRRPRALTAVVASALLLAGCGSGPSQVGAAAVVGDTAISLDKVQELIDKAIREQPYAQKLASEHKLDVLGRAFVGQLVTHELLAQVAEKENVSADPGRIDAQLANDPLNQPVPADSTDETTAVSQVASRTRDHREELTDTYLAQRLADKIMPNLTVTFDFTSVGLLPTADGGAAPQGEAARAEAFELARQFAANPASATARIAQDMQTEQAARQSAAQSGQNVDNIPPLGGLGVAQPATQASVLATTPLYGSPAGTVTVFPYPSLQGVWFVGVVRQRSADKPVATEQADPPDATTKTAIGIRLLQPYLDQLGVRINPRYGTWDVLSMSILTPGGAPSIQGLVLLPGKQ